MPGPGQRSEGRVVRIAQVPPAGGDVVGDLELGPQVGGLDLGHDEVGAQVHPLVAADLAAEEPPAVGAIVVDDFGAGDERRVVDDDGAALPAGGEVLGLVKAEAADVADGAEGLAFVRGGQGGSGVFDDGQVVLFGQAHDGVHVACYASVMDRDDHARFGGDGGFDLGVIHVHASLFDVDHDRRGTPENKSVDCGDEGEARHDYFVARFDVDQ